MEVSGISAEGLDTSRALIRTKHTRENAIAFCRDYALAVTEECIREELARPLNDVVTANCITGEFTNFYGERHRFLGLKIRSSDFDLAKYAIMNLATRKIADGSSSSGYPVNIEIFRVLCPARAPSD